MPPRGLPCGALCVPNLGCYNRAGGGEGKNAPWSKRSEVMR